MTILGIDPGYARAGWAILEKSGQDLKLIKYGCIETTKETEHAERLKILNYELNKIIKKYKPEILAIEDLFFFKNLKTAIKVAEARGVILMTGINNNLKIKEFTPLQIKQALTGYGRADKNQIQQMVKMILKLKEVPKPDDAADAVAIAICCANSSGLSLSWVSFRVARNEGSHKLQKSK
ncbi:crossover junction endodeoxyribonuclease RuvC [Patescibacteria group bacterium]|nr:crossover junction endodeoxyribonuclease RuvC [Patescibacteria group bacterium]